MGCLLEIRGLRSPGLHVPRICDSHERPAYWLIQVHLARIWSDHKDKSFVVKQNAERLIRPKLYDCTTLESNKHVYVVPLPHSQ